MVALGNRPLERRHVIGQMGALLRHRGPDAHGIRESAAAAVGAERLRIIDPDPAADQPYTSPDGNVWVVLNGAIYNAPELRVRFSGYPFRSKCDAEVVVPLYMELGHSGLAELDGMFGLAIYDCPRQQLTLARDRAGEKPLFYSVRGREVWFASEMQPLLDDRSGQLCLDEHALRDFITLGYVPEPRTVVEDVRKVGAGTALVFTSDSQTTYTHGSAHKADAVARQQEPADRLEQLLAQSVAKQLTADVPIGIFASGGLDSSLLAALAAREIGPQKLTTFTVSFGERSYDETVHAQRVAQYLGTPHMVFPVDSGSLTTALDVITRRVAEPVGDPAILPTYLLAKAASDHVKVVLSGEGADELFGGYPTYLGHRAAEVYRQLPRPARAVVRGAVNLLPAAHGAKVPVEYLLKRFVVAADKPLPLRHVQWFGTGVDPTLLCDPSRIAAHHLPAFPDGADAVQQASLFDYRTYLRDNLLTKLDRATMLCSIEGRAPYLDRHVTDFALQLDSSFKVRGWTTKWLLKQVARRWLPRATVRRRKRGLSVPIADWLNADLRPDVDRLLAPERIEARGLLPARLARQLLREHQSRRFNHGRILWVLLMLEYWIERWASEE